MRDPIAMESIGVAFSQALELNIRNMVQKIKEYKVRIQVLEQEVNHYKSDKTNLIEFKVHAFELQGGVRNNLEENVHEP
jgi:hypothetical protein